MHAFSRFVAVCLSVCLVAASAAFAKQPIKKLKLDPRVPAVDLFDAIESGTVETTVMAKNAHEAHLLVTNNSDAPVTVQMPKAVVAIQVLKQAFGQPRSRTGNTNAGLPGGNMMGGAQPMGMGMNNMGNNMPGGQNNMPGIGFNNNGNGNGPGNGIFSVAPQTTVQVPMAGVCLAHGKPHPRPRMTYKLVKLEDFTGDPALQEMLKLFGTGTIDVQSAQAAVWHLTDQMTWRELREKRMEQWGGGEPPRYFSEQQVGDAENLIRQVREKVDSAPRRAETAAR